MKLSRNALSLLIVVLCVVLTGCGVIRDRSGDYVYAKNGGGVVVPPWYHQETVNASYPIPEITNNQVLTSDFKVPAPPDATLRILKEQFSVEIQDGQVWLLVNEPPSRVWPSLEKFLLSHSISFAHSNPQLGLAQANLDSGSVLARSFAKDIGLNDEVNYDIQILVTQGLKRNSSEVQMRLFPSDGVDEFKKWQGETSDLTVEEVVLGKTKSFMLENKDQKSFSLLASDIGGPSKVSLIANGVGDSFLKLDLDYDRAWSVVLRSIRDAGYPIADLDRSQGIVYLDVKDNDDKCGFFSWFCSSEKNAPEYDYRVDLKVEGDSVKVYVSNMLDLEDFDSQARILSMLLESAS